MGNANVAEQKQRMSLILHLLMNSKTAEAYRKVFLEAEVIKREILKDKNLV